MVFSLLENPTPNVRLQEAAMKHKAFLRSIEPLAPSQRPLSIVVMMPE